MRNAECRNAEQKKQHPIWRFRFSFRVPNSDSAFAWDSAIGCRVDHQLDHLLGVPAQANVFGRQPVEQIGCDGSSPCVPKSSLVSTMPMPNRLFQSRLTATRAVSGLFRADQPACQSETVDVRCLGAGMTAGRPGLTLSPLSRKFAADLK